MFKGVVSLDISGVGHFFFQAEDGIRDLVRSRGLGDVYKRQRASSSKTSMNTLPIVFLFSSGSLIPSRASRNLSAASTPTTFSPNQR